MGVGGRKTCESCVKLCIVWRNINAQCSHPMTLNIGRFGRDKRKDFFTWFKPWNLLLQDAPRKHVPWLSIHCSNPLQTTLNSSPPCCPEFLSIPFSKDQRVPRDLILVQFQQREQSSGNAELNLSLNSLNSVFTHHLVLNYWALISHEDGILKQTNKQTKRAKTASPLFKSFLSPVCIFISFWVNIYYESLI